MATVSDVRHPVLVYDVDTLSLVLWDGSLNAGSVAIGSIANTAFAVTKTALTAAAPAAASVGAGSGQVVASNANRKGLTLVNTSGNRISLGFGNAAVLDSGITLNPGGGVFVMDEYCFSTQAVNAIASGAGSNLAIQELA